MAKMNEKLGGTFTFPGTTMTVKRMGYGAMQLAGKDGKKRVWGPPKDVPEAIAVLREAVASGVNHIDTSDFYGPHVTNQIIKEALHPYHGRAGDRDQGGGAAGRAMGRGRMLARGRRLSMRCMTICGILGWMRWMLSICGSAG